MRLCSWDHPVGIDSIGQADRGRDHAGSWPRCRLSADVAIFDCGLRRPKGAGSCGRQFPVMCLEPRGSVLSVRRVPRLAQWPRASVPSPSAAGRRRFSDARYLPA